MSEINQTGFGEPLRRRREELKLSLDDVAASTRIRKAYLQALEEENLRGLPGAAYSVGFLRIYARQLGLPVEPLLASLTNADQEDDRTGPGPVSGDQFRSPKKGRRKGRGGQLALLAVLVLLLALAVRYFFQDQTGSVVPRPPQVVETPQIVPVPESKPQPLVSTPSGPPPVSEQPAAPAVELSVLPEGGAVVRMLPVSPGIMKVSLDNQEVREYQLQPEQALNWKVSGRLSCELSTAGLVRVWVEQQEIAVAEHSAFILKSVMSQESRP